MKKIDECAYNIYKFVIKSNVALLHSIIAKSDNDCSTFNFSFEKKDYNGKEIVRADLENGNMIIKSNIASYDVDVPNKTIRVYANCVNAVESTLYNLPFSFIALYYGELLLHSSGLYVNDGICAFCGEKGAGKSTLIHNLSKSGTFFSDDTIYLSLFHNKVRCYSGYPFVKLYDDALKSECDCLCFDKNVQNKNIVSMKRFDSLKNISILRKIYFIRRIKDADMSIVEVDDETEKKVLLFENIVGLKVYSYNLIREVLNYDIFGFIINNISFYYLDICDNLEWLITNHTKIFKKISEQNDN